MTSFLSARNMVQVVVNGVSLIIFLFNLVAIEGWHAYDEHKHQVMQKAECSPAMKDQYNMTEGSEQCPCYFPATRPYPHTFVEQLSLWPDLMTEVDIEHGETIYGSRWGLEEIWKSQNPENCRDAKYIISGGWPYGFGSRLHMEGTILAIAMHLGRVYLPHPDGGKNT